MTHEDPWPDPLEAKRLAREKEEALPDPLPGYGLGTARLGDHGLGAGRLKHSGLGEAHPHTDHGHAHSHEHEHDHTQAAPPPGLPGTRYQNAESWKPPENAVLVTPVHDPHLKPPESRPLPPPLISEPLDEPVKITRRQLFAAVASLSVLGVLVALALRLKPSGGGQFEELGQKLGQGPARSYKYVADGRKQLYWPNELKYVNAIPESDRMYIKDDHDLAGFTNYTAGKL